MMRAGARTAGDGSSRAASAARRVVGALRADPELPGLRPLQLVQGTGAAGDALLALALAGSLFFSVPETTARGRVALYLGLTMAPFAVVSPLLSRFLDRHRGGLRFVIVAAAIGRGGLAWLLATRIDSLYLFPIAFGILVLSRTTLVVRGAVIPSLLADSRALVRANSSLSKTTALMGMIAGIVGLGLIKWPGVHAELLVAAIVYTGGALFGLRLPTEKGRRPHRERLGARAAARSVSLRQALVAMAGMRLLSGFLVFHLAFALRREEFGSVGLGLLIGSAAFGGLAGAIVAPRLRGKLREEGILILMMLVAGLAGIAAGQWFSVVTAGALVFFFGLSAGAAKVAFDSIVQRETPDAARGWAFARFESIVQLAWVVGAFAPLIAPIPSGPGVFGVGVAANLLALVYTWGRHRVRSGAVA